MPRPFFGLLQRRQRLVLTVWGWLAIVIFVAIVGVSGVRGAYPFLAVQDPAPGGILVVEGWEPDYALRAALDEFRRNHYEGLFVTGAPMEQGYMSEYPTNAELSAALLIKLGADPKSIHAVPARPVRQDRTYAMALALREMLREQGFGAKQINLVSLGAHARRSRLLYEKAFGPATHVGIVAIPPRDFDPHRWWRSSQGFRIVTGEAIAYVYARCIF